VASPTELGKFLNAIKVSNDGTYVYSLTLKQTDHTTNVTTTSSVVYVDLHQNDDPSLEGILTSQLTDTDPDSILTTILMILSEPTYKVILLGNCSPQIDDVTQTKKTLESVTSAHQFQKIGKALNALSSPNKVSKRASSFIPV
jgi:hypothetical protein